MIGHFKMQPIAGIGVGESHLLIQLDAEARFGGRDDIALLPADGLLQEFGIEAAEGFD